MTSNTKDREWRFYIKDMLNFAEKVLSYTEGLDRSSFLADGLIHDATLRNIELIGEAAMHVSAEVRELHPDRPWHAMHGHPQPLGS